MNKNIIPTREQQSIINLTDGRHIVYAPAGSGKTEMLSHRVKKALANGVKPAEMICLTFTNKAALNMKKRIGDTDNLFVGNIHAFGSKFLFSNNLIPKQANILDEAEMSVLLNDARNEVLSIENELSEDKEDFKIKYIEHFINWQNQIKLELPEKVIDKTQEVFYQEFDYDNSSYGKKQELKLIYDEYEKLKQDFLALDFNDILNLSLHYMVNGKTSYKTFSWVQVDEFQDLNTIQWKILDLLIKQHCHIVLFGDTQQAIFSFMGADADALSQISQTCEKHSIYENHRSPQYLLDLYNDYSMRNLDPPWEKMPFSKKKNAKDENLLFLINGNQVQEMTVILRDFVLQKAEQLTEPIAILMSTNAQVSKMSKMCSALDIKHFPVSSFDLFDRKIIKDMLGYFQGLIGSKNRLDWVRIFALFTKTSLKASRKIINSIFRVGLHPSDLIKVHTNTLDIFSETMKNHRLVVFDTETTGLDTENDDIIQIAATEIINGVKGESFNVYIKTEKSLATTVKIHNITKDFLNKNGVEAKEGISSFIKFMGVDALLAHNAKYDMTILTHFSNRHGVIFDTNRVVLDTIDLSKQLYPSLNSYKLGNILKTLKLEGVASHNAIDDVSATVSLVLHLHDSNIKIMSERNSFLNKNQKQFEKYRKKIKPVWKDAKSKMNKEYPIYDLMDDFISVWGQSISDEEKIAVEKLKRFVKKQWTGGCSLFDFMHENLPIYKKLKESDLIIGDESVVISTIHRAKGLEWDTIIIPSCTDNKFPGYFAKKDARQNPEKSNEIIQEEARKLYVAMTRAKKTLVLSQHSYKTTRYGKIIPQNVSRFIQPVLNHFTKKWNYD